MICLNLILPKTDIKLMTQNWYAWTLKTFMITFNQFSVIYIYMYIINLFIPHIFIQMIWRKLEQKTY